MADRSYAGPTPPRTVPGLTTLEIASGVVLGLEQALAPAGVPAPDPLTALEDAIGPALRRPPCLVSFSGGMDSSFVLAVAARVARREGLPAPIPITWRFAGAPKAEESLAQQEVLAGLGVSGHQLLHADDDLDLVGPVAQRVLHRYGVLHPANVHLHLPIVERATGGSVLTGVGGDQVLTGWRPPGPRSPVRAARERIPGRVVAAVRRGRAEELFPWLQPPVARRVFSRYLRESRSEPRRLDRRIDWHARRRDVLLSCASLQRIAADHEVLLVNPLLDARFGQALGRQAAGRWALGRHAGHRRPSRGELLRDIARGTLPDVATAVRPKAHFLEVFLREPTREFVRSWDGSGVDLALVDVDALRALWSAWPIRPGSGALIQQLWLTAHPDTATDENVTDDRHLTSDQGPSADLQEAHP